MLKEKDATAVANLTVNIDGDTRALNKNLNEIEIKIDRIIGKLN